VQTTVVILLFLRDSFSLMDDGGRGALCSWTRVGPSPHALQNQSSRALQNQSSRTWPPEPSRTSPTEPVLQSPPEPVLQSPPEPVLQSSPGAPSDEQSRSPRCRAVSYLPTIHWGLVPAEVRPLRFLYSRDLATSTPRGRTKTRCSNKIKTFQRVASFSLHAVLHY